MAIGVVKTKFGQVSGVEYDGKYAGITVFRGVPYAKPPVGDLRWRNPVDMDPWDGVLVCDHFGDAPYQTFMKNRHYHEFYEHVGLPIMGEDVLYLNICTGAQHAGEKRPVFIWLHGGGLTDCYAYEEHFNPQELASKGIVVVTVGHRLSIFGYLNLPQLAAEQGGHSGNYGMLDQVKALEWIYDNIEAFGGDPENISVGGQSGGSSKAIVLANLPATKGKIKRVISQSGLKWKCGFADEKKAEQHGQDYFEYIGLDPNASLEELRALPAERIYQFVPRAVMPSSMVRDDINIPCDTYEELVALNENRVDYLNGCNLGEADVFADSKAGFCQVPMREYKERVGKNTIDTSEEFYAYFKNLLGPLYDKYDFENLVKVEDKNAWFMARWLSSMGLAGGAGTNVSRNLMLDREFGRYMSIHRPGSRVFTYFWSHMLPLVGQGIGTDRDNNVVLAWHSTELWFTFASLRPGMPPSRPWRELDYKMADIVSSYWANFMRCGDPNGEGLPEWPETGANHGYIELNPEFKGHTGLTKLEELCKEFVDAEFKLKD